MKLQFFDEINESNDIEFINDWMEANPKIKNKNYRVDIFQKVRSGKGYLLKTEEFMLFLFKNSSMCKHIITALETYVKNSEGGYPIYCHVANASKKQYALAADKDERVTYFNTGNGYTVSKEYADSLNTTATNPFL